MAKRRIVKPNKDDNTRRRLLALLASVLAIAAVLTIAFAVSGVFSQAVVDAVDLDEDPQSLYRINNAQDLISYSRLYAGGGRNCKDTLVLALTSGEWELQNVGVLNETEGYIPIGSSSRPFAGTIKIDDGAVKNFLLTQPLFGTVTTDMKIVDAQGVNAASIIIERATDAVAEPLLAWNVVQGEETNGSYNEAHWIVEMDTYSVTTSGQSTDYAYPFSGVVGSIADDCKVYIEFSHNAIADGTPASVVGSGNVGLICGTLGSNAELKVEATAAAGIANVYTITSTGAKAGAGGIVGVMGDGARLIFPENFVSTAGTISATSGYAGGLAGFVRNAEYEFTGSASSVTLANTVSGSLGAGGLYGYYKSTTDNGTGADADKRVFDLSAVTSASLTVSSGSNGSAGGVIGVLDATNDVKITDSSVSLSTATTNLTVNGFNRSVTLSGGANRGGIVGAYITDSLARTLLFDQNKVKITGGAGCGVLGKINNKQADGSTAASPAYVKIQNTAVRNDGGTVTAGLVGDMGELGSFLDVDGLISISGGVTNGLVTSQNAGVIRLAGVTDMGGKAYNDASKCASSSNAQLVGTRGNGLVYALGSGSDASWTFRRGDGNVDDIAGWGEVLRPKTGFVVEHSTNGVLSLDGTNHTVTIKAPVTSMTGLTDFIKTALNIQLGVTGQPAAGALRFEAANSSATLLAGSLSISANTDLSGTGIVALTRDNAEDTASAQKFTGSFNGNNSTITLAIGEPYGYSKTGDTALTTYGYNNYGTVFKHRYLGLFSGIDLGASGTKTIQNLTIAGNISAVQNANAEYFIGGVAAVAAGSGGTLNVTNVKTTQTNSAYIRSDVAKLYCGGAFGCFIDGASGTVNITGTTAGGSSFGTTTVENRQPGSGKTNGNIYMGGCIGSVYSTGNIDFNVGNGTANGVYVGGSYNNTSSNEFSAVHYGGLIGYIRANDGSGQPRTTAGDDVREVKLKNIFIPDSASITSKITSGTERTNGAGGFLGSHWYNTKVTIGTSGNSDGVTLGSSGTGPSITVPSGSTGSNIGALVYKATGLWTVHHVNVVKATVTSAVDSTFGFLVNDGRTDSSALWLEVTGQPGTNYNLSELSFSNSSSTNVFDEVVAFTNKVGTNIEQNEQAIVSIKTTDGNPVVMTGSGCNTYQNQTAYGKNTSNKQYNSNSRYYYNLDLIRAKTAAQCSDGEKLLLWSLNTYAHSKLKGGTNKIFTNPLGSTLTGNFDMAGISYYPVNASGVTLNTATFKFYNSEIENGEGLSSGGSDNLLRTTGIAGRTEITQHYLMHTGLFLNYTGTLNINGTVTLQGNVGVTNQRNSGSGFIVSRTLGGNTNTPTIVKTNGAGAILLDGAVIAATKTSETVNNWAGGVYAPLIINKIGSNTNMQLSKVSVNGTGASSAYDTLIANDHYAASSLIGDVGSASSASITLDFSEIVLDARKADTVETALTTTYHTARTLFDRATLLNKFTYNDSSTTGTYNYTWDEDWGSTSHQVTYGWEVTHSLEYQETLNGDTVSKERAYLGSVNLTSPSAGNIDKDTGYNDYDFSSTDYLPYVYTPYNTTNHTHELKVNIAASSMEEGCGKYNDPYKIPEGKEGGSTLSSIANIIANDLASLGTNFRIILPVKLVNGSYQLDTSTWHDSNTVDLKFHYDSANSKFKNDASTNPSVAVDTIEISLNAVRAYLAGAYYYIPSVITIPAGYVGLGAIPQADNPNNYETQYAFRGVIVGKRENDTNVTIINNSAAPLIKNANGCVVRNLNVYVDVDSNISLSVVTNSKYAYYNGNNPTYGGLIGQVMGGDNIIDCVSVTYSSSMSITVNDDGYERLAAIGGYVGALVNGGVIFRNMSAGQAVGLTSTSCDYVDDDGWLYVNPIIGRVIAGYAFNEASTYAASSQFVLNGSKNYTLCDLVPGSANKLIVNASSATAHTITVPDAQAFYILSCIVNSGAGSAPYNASTEQAYPALSSEQWLSAYRQYTTTRCAQYTGVGVVTTSTAMADCADYNNVVRTQDVYRSNSEVMVPYIIRQYTASYTNAQNTTPDSMFRARSICIATIITAVDNSNKNEKAFRLYWGTDGSAQRYNISNGKYSKNSSGNYVEVTSSMCPVSSITLTANGSFNLPASYRGIGSIYSDNSGIQLRFGQFIGNNSTVSLDMFYVDYTHKAGDHTDDSSTAVENYKPFTDAGFGLFNNLYQISASSSNSIANLTLAGSVYTDYRKLSDGSVPKYAYGWHNYNNETGFYEDVADRIEATTILHTGGIAGVSKNTAYLKNVTLSSLSVEGSKYTGGMLGYVKGKNVTIEQPSATDLTVVSGFCAGGLIGGFYNNANLSIFGTSENVAQIGLTKIKVKGEPSVEKHGDNKTDFQDMFHCAGGICGYLSTSINNDSYKAEIEYISVVGGSIEAPKKNKRPNDMRYKIATGGFFGRVNTSKLILENCFVSSASDSTYLTIEGNLCGGLIGFQRDGFIASIKNVSINRIETQSLNSAGGLIGYLWSYKNIDLIVSIDSLSITDSKIFSLISSEQNVGQGQGASAGGIVGCFYSNIYSASSKFDVSNTKLVNCEIKCESTYTSQTPIYSGIGGMYGCLSISTKNKEAATTGHNILLEGIKIYDNTVFIPGIIIGNNGSRSALEDSKIKLVGVSIQGTLSDVANKTYKTVGEYKAAYGLYGTDGYVVFADFNGSSVPNTGLTQNTVNASIETTRTPRYNIETVNGVLTATEAADGEYVICATGETVEKTAQINGANENFISIATHSAAIADYYAASPYVTVNPGLSIGNSSVLLTGDGMASTAEGLTIHDIIANNGAQPYAYSSSSLAVFSPYSGRFSTFNTEQGTTFADDFAVLIVDDMDRDVTNSMIESYLKLLTNTSFSFGTDNAAYDVVIHKMTYENGAFTKDTGASLQRGAGKFYMLGNLADTSATQFSLIDVQFKDPADTSKIAYHLYVPVIVKKLLKYNFTVATASDTNYERAWYDANNRWGAPLMENLGTPVTLYFMYDYQRTISDWQKAIDNGEDLMRNYNKSLILETVGTNVNLSDFEDTLLILVDPNNNGKPYYASWTDFYDNGVYNNRIDLSLFREGLGSGDYFRPVAFNDMLDIRYTSGSGDYVSCDEGLATIYATDSNGANKLYFRLDDSKLQQYTISGGVATPVAEGTENAYVECKESVAGRTAATLNGETRYFREASTTDSSAAHYTLTVKSTSFKATAAADGGYVSCNQNTAGSIPATLDGEIAYFREATSGDSGATHYTLTSPEERYYISFFTKTVKNATADASGGYVACQQSDAGSIAATLNGVTAYFREAGDGDSAAQHYSLASNNILYHFKAKYPTDLGDSAYPSRINNPETSAPNSAHLFVGNIFSQTDFTVKTNTENEEMTLSNKALSIQMATTVTIADPDGQGTMFDTVNGYLSSTSGIDVYQSFLVKLQRIDQHGSRFAILGLPNGNGSYTISSVSSGAGVPADSTDDYEQLTGISGSYAEFANGVSLNEYLVDGGGAQISASMTLTYSNIDAITEQFPSKDEVDYGVRIFGSSNMAFDPGRAVYSKSATDDVQALYNMSIAESYKLYYSRIESKDAILYYNAVQSRSDPTNTDVSGTLGINPLDPQGLTSSSISTTGIFDVSTVEYDAANYDKMRCELRLSAKNGLTADDYGGVGTNHYLPISQYLSGVTITSTDITGDSSYNTSADEYVIVFEFDKDLAETAVSTIYNIPIDFTVITGSAFESASGDTLQRFYANYKVTLSVTLFKTENGSETVGPGASNYIIYTNARIIPDFIVE